MHSRTLDQRIACKRPQKRQEEIIEKVYGLGRKYVNYIFDPGKILASVDFDPVLWERIWDNPALAYLVAVNLDDSQANDKQPLLTATGFSHFASRGNGNKVNVKVGLKQVSELKCNIAECKQHEITGPCRHEIALLQKLVLMIMRENPGEVTDYQADRALARAEMLEEFDQDALEDVKLLAQHGFGGILADEMGLGKTLQVISLLASQKDQPSLIVAPASLVLNWEAEFKKFAPEMKTLVLSGSKKERSGQLADLTDIDVVITSYDLLKRDIANYEPHTFAYEVIDEAQMIKNPRTAAAKSVSVAKAKHRFALTGTPIENRLSELWSIFNFLMPGFLKSYREFKKDFESPIVKEDDQDCLNRLSQMVGPFILRRLKKTFSRTYRTSWRKSAMSAWARSREGSMTLKLPA